MKIPLRLLVIENQTLVRVGIRTILGADAGFEIVGLANRSRVALPETRGSPCF